MLKCQIQRAYHSKVLMQMRALQGLLRNNRFKRDLQVRHGGRGATIHGFARPGHRKP